MISQIFIKIQFAKNIFIMINLVEPILSIYLSQLFIIFNFKIFKLSQPLIIKYLNPYNGQIDKIIFT